MARYAVDIPKAARQATDQLYQQLQGFLGKYYDSRRFAMAKWVDYWKGDQAKYLKKYEGETDTEYRGRIEKTFVENHCKPGVNINVAYMYGMTEKISRRADNEELHRLLHDEVYELNDMHTLMIDTRWMANITGFGIIELQPHNRLKRMVYKGGEQITKDNFSVLYVLNDSTTIIPFPRVNDRRSLGMVIRFYELDSIDTFESLGVDAGYDPNASNWILEFVDDDIWLRWLIKGDKPAEPEFLPVFSVKGQENVNIYGDVRVPFVNFKNYGDPMTMEGESEVEDNIPLQDNLNERMSDDALTIRYHAVPVVKFLKGAKVAPGFTRKPNDIWEFDGDGDAEYLVWQHALEASDKYKEELRHSLAQITQVSSLSRGDLTSVGQLRTGIGVKSLYVPDILGIRLRKPFMIRAEKELIRSTARFYEFFAGYDFKNNYKCEVIMPEDFIGMDEWMETQIAQTEIAAGLPIEDRLKARYPEKSEDEIKELAEMVMEMKKPQQQKGMFPNPEAKQLKQE